MSTSDGPSTSLSLLAGMLSRSRRERAWETFLERYTPLIRRWCIGQGLQHAVADDIVAGVSARLLTRLETYDPHQGAFRPWLKTVALNLIRDYFREICRRPGVRGSGDSHVRTVLERLEAPGGGEELAQDIHAQLGRDEGHAIAAVKCRVREANWQAFWLKVCEDRPAAEIADALGMSAGAVHQAAYRISGLLRQEYRRLVGLATDGAGDVP